MKKNNIIMIIFLCVICFLTSCVKEDISYSRLYDVILMEEDNKKNKEFEDSIITTNIYFNSCVEQLSSTQSSKPLSAERYVVLYTFNKSFNTDITKYYSKTAGTLSPLKSPLSLLTGTYNFYAVCINADNVSSPSFINGEYDDIKLDTDYLWWADYNIIPQYPSSNYTINFQHCSTQVIILLKLYNYTSIDKLNYICLTPCVTDNIKWDLYSGDIGPSSAVCDTSKTLSYIKQNDSCYYSQLTMPPIKVTSTTNLTATFQVVYENDTLPKTYHVELPIYENYLEPGNTYKYRISLINDSILFDEVSIIDWIDVNVDKTPIIPTGES